MNMLIKEPKVNDGKQIMPITSKLFAKYRGVENVKNEEEREDCLDLEKDNQLVKGELYLVREIPLRENGVILVGGENLFPISFDAFDFYVQKDLKFENFDITKHPDYRFGRGKVYSEEREF